MKLHYRSQCAHGHTHDTVQLAKSEPSFDRLIEQYIRALFDEREVSDELKEKLWAKYYNKLTKGLDKGYSPKLKHYDNQLGAALKKNISVFSAFKETSFRKELEANLTDNGKFLPWSDFKKKAASISGNYNKRWLETEYHHTVANANMAKKWKRFERDKYLYSNLKYDAVNDSQTRAKHKAWDGVILPIDHPWWETHLPPNDWGCRCDAIQTDEPVTAEIPEGKIKAAFSNNPAKSGEVFAEIAYADGLTSEQIGQSTANALAWLAKDGKNKTISRYAEKLFYELPRKWQFKEIYNRKGRVLEHLMVDKNGVDYQEVKASAIALAKIGREVEMLSEVKGKDLLKFHDKIFPDYNLIKNPDLRVNGQYMDIKRPTAIKNFVRNANKAFNDQNSIAIIYVYDYLPINREIIKRRAEQILGPRNNKNYGYEDVYFIYEGEAIKFNRHELYE